jgi:hypothetical protein
MSSRAGLVSMGFRVILYPSTVRAAAFAARQALDAVPRNGDSAGIAGKGILDWDERQRLVRPRLVDLEEWQRLEEHLERSNDEVGDRSQ